MEIIKIKKKLKKNKKNLHGQEDEMLKILTYR